jgi:hypothetical protein
MRIRLVQLGLMPLCTDGDTSPPKGAESLGNTDDWDFHS